eukprot:13643907-Alexandrium_andersonii.AAC.1
MPQQARVLRVIAGTTPRRRRGKSIRPLPSRTWPRNWPATAPVPGEAGRPGKAPRGGAAGPPRVAADSEARPGAAPPYLAQGSRTSAAG